MKKKKKRKTKWQKWWDDLQEELLLARRIRNTPFSYNRYVKHTKSLSKRIREL